MARLLADEDFPRAVSSRLRSWGHDVLTVQEAGWANSSTPDAELLHRAIAQRRAVLTHNRLDFKRLHYAFHLHCGIVLCTRDPDTEGLAARIQAALATEPEQHAALIRVDRGGWSRSDDKKDAILSLLRNVWPFGSESHFHLECLTSTRFRLTEVATDLSVLRRISGYLDQRGGITSAQEPDLTLAQAQVFDAVIARVLERLAEAERQAEAEFPLFANGEHPELFGPLDLRPTVAGNVHAPMRPVWQAVSHLLMEHGYMDVVMLRLTPDPTYEVWAMRRRPR